MVGSYSRNFGNQVASAGKNAKTAMQRTISKLMIRFLTVKTSS